MTDQTDQTDQTVQDEPEDGVEVLFFHGGFAELAAQLDGPLGELTMQAVANRGREIAQSMNDTLHAEYEAFTPFFEAVRVQIDGWNDGATVTNTWKVHLCAAMLADMIAAPDADGTGADPLNVAARSHAVVETLRAYISTYYQHHLEKVQAAAEAAAEAAGAVKN